MSPIKRLAAVMIASALLVTACGSGGGSAPTPSSQQTKATDLNLTGAAVLRSHGLGYKRAENSLTFYDVDTGKVNASLRLPETDDIVSKHEMFSADWHYFAWPSDDGAIKVYRLDAAQQVYLPVGSFTPPPASMTDAKVSYQHPVFSADGAKLFFRGGQTLYSGDYRDPGQAAKVTDLPDSLGFRLDPQGRVQVDGDKKHTYTADQKLFSYYTDSTGAIFDADLESYEFVTTLAADTVLMSTIYIGDERGTLISAKVDTTANAVSFTKIVDSTLEAQLSVKETVASPDRQRVLFRMSKGKWFVGTLAPGNEPRPVMTTVGEDDENTSTTLLAWS